MGRMPGAGATVLWRAQPGPQTWLISCPIGDLFFGGSRGGGKTDGCLGDWMLHAQSYGKDARGVWFRRSLPEIEGAQSRMLALFPALGGTYIVQSRTWRFPNGATLRLRYLEADQDATRYQGHSTTWLCFDEVQTWATSFALDMLRATLRSAAGVPTRLVCTGNPGGRGHEWVKRRYIDPAPPLTPFVGEDGTQRVFIPSKLQDNQALMLADPTYVDRLRASGPEWLVRAWLEGDWDARLEGDIVKAEWLSHTWDRLPDRRNLDRVVVSVDCANKTEPQNDWTAIVVLAEFGGHVAIVDCHRVKLTFPDLQARVAAVCAQWTPNVVLIEDAANGTALLQQLRATPTWRWPTLPVKHGGKSKVVRLFAETPMLESGRVLLPRAPVPWVRSFRDELLRFPTGPHDDQVDALSQGLEYLRRGVGARALFAA